eukprot:674874-Prymnesium_polylepis.2
MQERRDDEDGGASPVTLEEWSRLVGLFVRALPEEEGRAFLKVTVSKLLSPTTLEEWLHLVDLFVEALAEKPGDAFLEEIVSKLAPTAAAVRAALRGRGLVAGRPEPWAGTRLRRSE